MIAALDVNYKNDFATAACIIFKNWTDTRFENSYITQIKNPQPYEPGKFYKRELPCILKVLNKINIRFNAIIIDSFIYLKPPYIKGLGLYLAESLDYEVTIVGVAKNYFKYADKFIEVFRGKSSKPLYVSVYNGNLKEISDGIIEMKGSGRMPYLLKEIDRISKSIQ